MSASVELLDLSVRFGAITALDGVDLDVAAGEVVAVLGPSGSGKSTLLRCIAGLQRPDCGQVVVGGRDLAGVPPHQRGVGMMFQQPALFPHRDVAGNIGFGLRQLGQRGREVDDAVAELLDLVGLPGTEHRSIDELSGGEQQRVALARALAPKPSVLLLDEPMGALDRVLRERLVRDLRVLFDQIGVTVLAVTHDQAEAFALADRVVVMAAGRAVQVGTPAAVWRAPADPSVAALLGLGNVIDAVVVDGTATSAWGTVAVPGGDGAAVLLVRPAGAVLDPAGTVEATVVTATFQGGHTTVELAVTGAPALRIEVPSASAPARGDSVRIRLVPGEVVRLDG